LAYLLTQVLSQRLNAIAEFFRGYEQLFIDTSDLRNNLLIPQIDFLLVVEFLNHLLPKVIHHPQAEVIRCFLPL